MIQNFFADLMKSFQPSQEELNEINVEANKRYLCGIVNAYGLDLSTEQIPASWEISQNPDPIGMEKLAHEYIEYRREKSTGKL